MIGIAYNARTHELEIANMYGGLEDTKKYAKGPYQNFTSIGLTQPRDSEVSLRILIERSHY